MTSEKESLKHLAKDLYAFPLSFAQQRLWFLNQLEPDSPVYNQGKAVRLRGRLNREALQRALDTIVERHEVLRTTFSSVDDQPAQVIHEPATVELTAIDLMGIPIEQREEALHRVLSDFTHRRFDLEKDWPLRATLIRLAGEEHILLVVMHHIASDGWSNDILFRELSALYESVCQGKSCPLKDLPIQYADYAGLQKEWLQGEVLQQQLSYWKKQLKDLSPLELPTDHPRPAVVGHLGQSKTFNFPPTLALGLKNLSRREGVTLFMTLLAAFQTLLHRYSGQDDIVVGSPIAGRTRVEIEGLIGFFVNTLVLRNDLSGNPTFREFLARVRKNALDAYTHQEVPFEKLVEELQPERDLSRNPFFQVMFQLRNYPAQSVSLGDVNIEEYEFGSDIAKFDLSVGLRDGVTGLTGSVEYRTDLFDQTTIERMIGHFQTLLEGIAANPEQRISALPLLTDPERQQLLIEWNDTETDYPKDKCIQELFEAQVEKTPDAIAVVFEDQRLTYRELNRRANQLAHYLRKLGVGPDVLVGICMERSIEMIVGLLGILKAGGAYVPMDPAYPKERLAFMLDDTQAPVLLTQRWLLETFSKHGTRVICLDADWEAIAQEHEGNPVREGEAENLAYVIYTSGSTGSPKGVLIEHRQIRNYVSGIWDRFGLESGASFAMVQPLSVDSSQTVIFPSLISGGSLHVIPEDKAVDPGGIREYFLRHPIDLLKIAPSHLAALQASSDLDPVLPRCWLVIGGEASGRSWVESLQARAHCSILNHYGPTEATVGMLTYRAQKDRDVQTCSTIPIGRPLPNTQVYLLDRHLQPVPIGVPGELYIGGSCLARGYLNRPELTAEKFVPSPFSEEPEARIYKSGDMARWLPDGNIEFLGRTDDQIKIRGFRIEPGEIEAALADYPGVRQSVVLVREDEPNQKRLVAYVVSKQEARPTKSDLRNFLAQKLPNHMVPSAFVLLETLPRTSQGKVNRRALPTPDQNRPELEETFVAPRTAVEEALASIWAAVLKLDKIGIHDNFFELGGHSLLAIQLISRIRDTFKLDLPLRSLFEAPTIDGLAQRLQELGEKQEVMRETKITRVAREQYRVQQEK